MLLCVREGDLVCGEEGLCGGELVREDGGVGGDCGHGLAVGGEEGGKGGCGGDLGLDVFTGWG